MNSIAAALLRGERIQWTPEFLQFLQQEGLQPLAFYQIKNHSLSCPPEFLTILERAWRREIACRILLEEELRKILQNLQKQKVFPLLMKGTPLGYTHYPQPALRCQSDTDLLIRESDRFQFDHTLKSLGYEIYNSVTGAWISHQTLYTRRNQQNVPFSIDCHWKISNPVLFCDFLTYDELYSRAVAVEPLCGKTLSPIDSLLLACVHRVAHHRHQERLLWFYDMYLLQAALSPEEFDLFLKLARQKQVLALCIRELQKAKEYFGSLSHELPEEIPEELSARFLDPNMNCWRLHRENLSHLGTGQKFLYLMEVLFPPARYMMKKYSTSHRWWLPFLYIRRIAGGAAKVFSRS